MEGALGGNGVVAMYRQKRRPSQSATAPYVFFTEKRVTNDGSFESSWRPRFITAIAVSSPPTRFSFLLPSLTWSHSSQCSVRKSKNLFCLSTFGQTCDVCYGAFPPLRSFRHFTDCYVFIIYRHIFVICQCIIYCLSINFLLERIQSSHLEIPAQCAIDAIRMYDDKERN